MADVYQADAGQAEDRDPIKTRSSGWCGRTASMPGPIGWSCCMSRAPIAAWASKRSKPNTQLGSNCSRSRAASRRSYAPPPPGMMHPRRESIAGVRMRPDKNFPDLHRRRRSVQEHLPPADACR